MSEAKSLRLPLFGILTIAFICCLLMLTMPTKAEASITSAKIPSSAKYYQGHYYKVYNSSLTWTEAKAACEKLGGHLVTITSSREQKYVNSILGKGKNLYWIGYSSTPTSRTYKWVTGEKSSYKNWGEGEPNKDFNDTEFYAQLYAKDLDRGYTVFRKGQWNDARNDGGTMEFYKLENVGYICEWDGQWEKVSNNYRYIVKNGKYLTGWKTINGKKYYFSKLGYRYTGWHTIKSAKYYFSSKGVMATGWKTIKGSKYYFNSNGKRAKGLNKIGSNRYHFKSNTGKMSTGWVIKNGNKYYFKSSGKAAKGWTKIKGKYYYFNKSSNVMQKNKWIGKYHVNGAGVRDKSR